MPMTPRRNTVRAVRAVTRIVLHECLGSPGMRLTVILLLVAGIAAAILAPLWLDPAGAVLAAALAPQIAALVILMSFVTGPMARDLAAGTTLALRVTAVTTRQIAHGTAAALTIVTLPIALLTAGIALASTGSWPSLPGWLAIVLLSPALAATLILITVAIALRGALDQALIVPWIATMLVGTTIVLLAALADMPADGWGTATIIAVAAVCGGLAVIAVLPANTPPPGGSGAPLGPTSSA